MDKQSLKAQLTELFHKGAFQQAAHLLVELGSGALQLVEAATLPAPVAGPAQVATKAAAKLAEDTITAATDGDDSTEPDTVAARDGRQLVEDVSNAVVAQLSSQLPGFLGTMAAGIAQKVEASVLAKLAPAS